MEGWFIFVRCLTFGCEVIASAEQTNAEWTCGRAGQPLPLLAVGFDLQCV